MSDHPYREHYLQALALALSLVALFSYDLIPKRVYALTDLPTEQMNVYGDQDEGGNSEAVLHSKEPSIIYQCKLGDAYLYAFCGFVFDLSEGKPGKFVNLSRFSKLRFQINASENAALVKIYIRNYNPVYSKAKTGSTLMYMFMNVAKGMANQEVEIPLDRFRVAEWWLEQNQVDWRYAALDFTNVQVFGVDINKISDDKPATVEIRTMEFEGELISKENWYLLIAMGWMSYFLFRFVRSWFRVYRQAKSSQELIEAMTEVQNTLIEQNSEYEKSSIHDPLTDIYNRRGLIQRLESLHQSSYSNDTHSVIVADIDHFKSVNDNYGHDVGDQVIKKVTELCSQFTRGHDILCRWGGEEFILVCPYCDPNNAISIANKIREKLKSYNFLESQELFVSLSCGITSYTIDEKFDKAFKRADIALLQAKREGRDRCVLFKEGQAD